MSWVCSSYVVVLTILSSVFRLTNAKESCYGNQVCYDKFPEIGYCCSVFGQLCCYYKPVYTLWYFWVGIILLLLSLVVCVIRKGNKPCCPQPLRPSATDGLSFRQRPIPVTRSINHQSDQIYNNDVLPSYAQVQQQELSFVNKEHSKESFEVDLGPPSYNEIHSYALRSQQPSDNQPSASLQLET